MIPHRHLINRRRAFSLLETVFAMFIAGLVALGTIATIIYSRQSMELDKQRLSALNICRDYIEQAHAHINVSANNVPLVNFDTPITSSTLEANVAVDYFPFLAHTSGGIDWANPVLLPDASQPYYCRVTVAWNSIGSGERPHMIRMGTIISRSGL